MGLFKRFMGKSELDEKIPELLKRAEEYLYGRGGRMKHPEWAARELLEAAGVVERNRSQMREDEFYDLSITIYLSVANSYRDAKIFNKAIDYYNKVLELSSKSGIDRSFDSSFNGISECHEALGDYENAIKYRKKTADLHLRQGDIESYQHDMSMTGQLFEKNNDFQSAAETYLKSAEKGDTKYGQPNFMAAKCFLKLKDWNKAAENFVKSAEHSLRKGYPDGAGRGYLFAAVAKHESGADESEMEDFVRRSIMHYGNLKEDYMSTGHHYLGRCYELLDQLDTSKEHFDKAEPLIKKEIKKYEQRADEEENTVIRDMHETEAKIQRNRLTEHVLLSSRVDARIAIENREYENSIDILEGALIGWDGLVKSKPIYHILYEVELERTRRLLAHAMELSRKPKERPSAMRYYP